MTELHSCKIYMCKLRLQVTFKKFVQEMLQKMVVLIPHMEKYVIAPLCIKWSAPKEITTIV